MAIVGVGIDVVEIARVGRALASGRYGHRFKERVFTAAERANCDKRMKVAEGYAVRFAAKEAVMKALGVGTRWGFAWPDIEVVRDRAGAPSVVLRGRTAERARRLGVERVHVSLSHGAEVAVANAVAVAAG